MSSAISHTKLVTTSSTSGNCRNTMAANNCICVGFSRFLPVFQSRQYARLPSMISTSAMERSHTSESNHPQGVLSRLIAI